MPYEDEEPPYVEPDAELDGFATIALDCCFEVSKVLGPGLDEATYEAALAIELRRRGVPFARQVVIEIGYKGEIIGEKRLDFLIGGRLIVEIKSVEALTPLHFAQVRTYLKITKKKLALLVNFNVPYLKDGIKRIIYGAGS